MNHEIHLFVGPSLPSAMQNGPPEFVFHGPAAQGDVYRSAQSCPRAIALIDGYFERVPAVWHKEILWALSRGIHVFGAASMGALRAAELADFGMVGVGRVFDDFRSGRLQDDDEVALVHGDAASGYRPGSEAMVNLRASLEAARSRELLSEAHFEGLVSAVKSRFYPDRSFPNLFQLAKTLLPAAELKALTSFLSSEEGRIDLKRADAQLLVQTLIEFSNIEAVPFDPTWTFQHTDAWETVRRRFLVSENHEGAP
jgi:hypothetical protein